MAFRTLALALCFTCLCGVSASSQTQAELEIKEMADAMGVRLYASESDNFIWGLGVTRAQASSVIRSAEKAFSIWKKISGIKDWKQMWGSKKALFMILKTHRQYRKFIQFYGKKYAGPNLWDGFASHYSKARFCSQPTPRVAAMMHLKPTDMKGLRNTAAHLVGHLCMQRYHYHNRPIPPWLEEGFASYLEARSTTKTRCYCFTGGYGDVADSTDKLTDLEWTKWKQMVKEHTVSGSFKNLKSILPLGLNELTADEIAKSWSVIDYLIKKNPRSFVRFIEIMKRRWPKSYDPTFSPEQETAETLALKEAFDLGWGELDNQWLAYVKKSYR